MGSDNNKRDEALKFFALIKEKYTFGNPRHDRDELYKLGESTLGLDPAGVDALIDWLVLNHLVRVCYPEVGEEPHRVDDWFLDFPKEKGSN